MHQDYDKALVKFAVLSELGYETAQCNLAYMYEKKEGSLYPKTESVRRAFFYWERAAFQGYSQARIKLGDFHYYGLGTDINFEEAANQYRQAAENQNNAQAMFNLGYMHERGHGIKKDIYLAKRYYDLAMETSVDAYIPVTMALAKLTLLFLWDGIKSSWLYNILPDLQGIFGRNWDFMCIGLILGVISALWLQRRQRRLGV